MTNYFEFYGLPVTLDVDQSLLKAKYYALSRDYHPDFHTLAGETQQQDMLKKSAINNEAYQVLSQFNTRIKHILTIFNKLKEEGENKVPQDFLMDMMDLNEGLMALEMDPSDSQKQQLINALAAAEDETKAGIAGLIEKNVVQQFDEREWDELVDYYLKSKYLQRLRSGIQQIVST